MTYLEAATGAIYLDKPHETSVYNGIWANMTDRALNEVPVKSLIQQSQRSIPMSDLPAPCGASRPAATTAVSASRSPTTSPASSGSGTARTRTARR